MRFLPTSLVHICIANTNHLYIFVKKLYFKFRNNKKKKNNTKWPNTRVKVWIGKSSGIGSCNHHTRVNRSRTDQNVKKSITFFLVGVHLHFTTTKRFKPDAHVCGEFLGPCRSSTWCFEPITPTKIIVPTMVLFSFS